MKLTYDIEFAVHGVKMWNMMHELHVEFINFACSVFDICWCRM